MSATTPHALSPAPEFFRKPMAKARRVTLFEREIHIKLSKSAIDILFENAEILSEGQLHGSGYFGSTMITINLELIAPAIRERCDAASARRVAQLVASDARIRERAHAIAITEAHARAGQKLLRLDVDLNSRSQGSLVHIDLDVEGQIAGDAA